MISEKVPVAVIGAGPVGLVAGLELDRFGIGYRIYEDDDTLSSKPKAGTILPRSLEIFAQEGVIDGVLKEGLRFDEVAFIDRLSDRVLMRMLMHPMAEETRYPFVLNLPQSDLERILAEPILRSDHPIAFGHRLVDIGQSNGSVELTFETAAGPKRVEASYVLACDGGRSAVRHLLDIAMEGITHPERFLVADFDLDLDRRAGRQLTYLSYIFDPEEWVIFVRQPAFWRFLIPVPPDQPDPSSEEVMVKVRRVVKNPDLPVRLIDLGIYHVHHRTAVRWREGRIFLLGDAAHLITPVGGLGLNTGVQDAHNLVWKLAWVMRRRADARLLDTYEAERAPIARFNARNQADRNREIMRMRSPLKRVVRNLVLGWMDRAGGLQWQAAYVRSLLGTSYKARPKPPSWWDQVRTARHFTRPASDVGDRFPDAEVFGPDGRRRALHELVQTDFVALVVVDPRKHPELEPDPPGLTQYVLHQFDAAVDTGVRERFLYDTGGQVMRRLGTQADMVYLIRPDHHIAAMAPYHDARTPLNLYQAYVGRNAMGDVAAPMRQLG